MRAALPLALVLVFLSRSLAGQTASALADQLVLQLRSEETAARQQDPPANDRAMALHNAADTLRQWMGGDHGANILRTRSNDPLPTLRSYVASYPQLTKLVQEWTIARTEEDRAWEKAACEEMLAADHAAAAKTLTAQAPADLDEAVASLALMSRKYPSDRGGGGTTADWMVCARDNADLLSFVMEMQTIMAAEKSGLPRDALYRLGGLFRRESVPFIAGSERLTLLNAHARKLGQPSTDEAEAKVRAILAKVIATTKPEELDPILAELTRTQQLWGNGGTGDPHARDLSHIMETGRQFVLRWQEFLVDRAAGELNRAHNTVQMLARNAENEPLYPRSAVLAAAATVMADPAAPAAETPRVATAADTLLATIHTLDDLTTRLPEIKAGLKKISPEYMPIGTDLDHLLDGYARLRAGDLEGAKVATLGGFNKHPKVVELRGQLNVQLAATALHAVGPLTPHPDEKLNDYILRLVADAQQRKDWDRLQEILETVRKYPSFWGILGDNDTTALRTFVTARNLDVAGVWPAAVSGYIRALTSGSPIVPAAEINRRLDAIRHDHPADYKRGSGQSSVASIDDISIWPWVAGTAALFTIAVLALKRRV